jgi:ferric-dicitrate binding protein FerR (iron transport regulator)
MQIKYEEMQRTEDQDTTDRPIAAVIARQLAGEATDADRAQLYEWLAMSEENRAIYRTYRAYWKARVEVDTQPDTEAAFERLMKRLPDRKKAICRPHHRWLWAAAAAAILIGAWVIFPAKEKAPVMRENYSYMAANEVSAFTLPDGTEVTLNRHSRITYSVSSDRPSREVVLTGEAFFQVTKDAGREFVVIAGKGRIGVTGTSFDVCYMPENDSLTATLIEGGIHFTDGEKDIHIQPNQQLEYRGSDGAARIREVEGEVVSAWREKLIRYRSITFDSFARMLEKEYSVEIRISDRELGASMVSGTFDAGLSVDRILELMQKSLSYKWKKKGNIYEISKH